MHVSKSNFARLNGKQIDQYTICNDNGMKVSFINYGCIITDIIVPDREGILENVVLGFDTLEEYIEHSPYFGAIVGRVAGRIKKGSFELNGRSYDLPKNDGENHLHGGNVGFSNVVWNAEVVKHDQVAGVHFTYISQNGEEGYPGTVMMNVTYLLNDQNEFKIVYDGNSDQATLLNVTNHTYFNLSGNLRRDVQDHLLTLDSDQFLELSNDLLPTGCILDVADTPFDFTKGRKIRDGVHSVYQQNILASGGYDHPFLLKANHDKEIVLEDKKSGRKLVVETDQPCVVVYSGNQLEDDFQIRNTPSKKHLGICLETQGLPDAIHHEHFPSVLLRKGEVYHSETSYTFLAANS